MVGVNTVFDSPFYMANLAFYANKKIPLKS